MRQLLRNPARWYPPALALAWPVGIRLSPEPLGRLMAGASTDLVNLRPVGHPLESRLEFLARSAARVGRVS